MKLRSSISSNEISFIDLSFLFSQASCGNNDLAGLAATGPPLVLMKKKKFASSSVEKCWPTLLFPTKLSRREQVRNWKFLWLLGRAIRKKNALPRWREIFLRTKKIYIGKTLQECWRNGCPKPLSKRNLYSGKLIGKVLRLPHNRSNGPFRGHRLFVACLWSGLGQVGLFLGLKLVFGVLLRVDAVFGKLNFFFVIVISRSI